MLIHAGILDGKPRPDDLAELAVLALTPGIPFEWVCACARLGPVRRSRLKDAVTGPELRARGQANALSVVAGDGWRMLTAIPDRPAYRGAVPLYSQLELLADPRTNRAIASELRMDHQKLRRWRVVQVFAPVSGQRLIGRRGSGFALDFVQ